VHPDYLARGCSDLELTWLLCCAGAATDHDAAAAADDDDGSWA